MMAEIKRDRRTMCTSMLDWIKPNDDGKVLGAKRHQPRNTLLFLSVIDMVCHNHA